jgi:hypothetical protein
MAKVTVAFSGVPDGEIYPKDFAPGDEVHGDLAAVAVREGWAEDSESTKEAEARKPTEAEAKARKAAPENKGA